MRLQTDPTVIYGMGERYNGKLSRKDLETPTAYNTYVISGMPPGPIAVPGEASLNAAAHPAKRRTSILLPTEKAAIRSIPIWPAITVRFRTI